MSFVVSPDGVSIDHRPHPEGMSVLCPHDGDDSCVCEMPNRPTTELVTQGGDPLSPDIVALLQGSFTSFNGDHDDEEQTSLLSSEKLPDGEGSAVAPKAQRFSMLRSLSGSVWAIYSIAALNMFTQAVSSPVILLYTNSLHWTDTKDLTLYVATQLANASTPVLFNAVLGWMGARVGIKPVLLGLTALAGLGFAGLAICDLKWLWFGAYTLVALQQCNRTLRVAFLSSHLSPAIRTPAMAFHALALPLGALLGPLVVMIVEAVAASPQWSSAGQHNGTAPPLTTYDLDQFLVDGDGASTAPDYSAQREGFRFSEALNITGGETVDRGAHLGGPIYINAFTVIFFVAALVCVLRCLILICFFRADAPKHDAASVPPGSAGGAADAKPKVEPHRHDMPMIRRIFTYFCFVMFTINLSMGLMTVCVQPILVNHFHYSAGDLARMFLIITLLAVIPPLLLAYLSRKLRDRSLILIGIVAKLLGMIMFCFPPQKNQYLIIVGFVLCIKASIFFFTTCIALFSKMLGPASSSTYIGWLTTFSSIGPVVGTSIGGQLLHQWYGKPIFMILCLPCVIGLLLLINPWAWTRLSGDYKCKGDKTGESDEQIAINP